MKSSGSLSTDLMRRYTAIGLKAPSWAFKLPGANKRVPPTIPFIGRNYGEWGGVLVYASAENLSHYARHPKNIPDYMHEAKALNRHREALAKSGRDGFFPNVHMAPFDDGPMLVATAYLLYRLEGVCVESPIDLLESIAVANFCKFSVSGRTNRDYIEDTERVSDSLEYVRADLDCLRPRIVVLPRKAFNLSMVWRMLWTRRFVNTIVPLPQFNSKVVNIHLRCRSKDAGALKKRLRDHPLAAWIENIAGFNPNAAYRFLAEIDGELARIDDAKAATAKRPQHLRG